jgi:type II secretory pathway pseudopilin PulG
MNIAKTAGLALGGVAIVALGVFVGQWGWQQHQQRQASAAAQAASAAAAAEAKTVRGQQRAAVLEMLHNPESGRIRNDRASAKNPAFWCGEVSAQNLMGATIGFTRYTALLTLAGDQVAFADVDFDPVSTISDQSQTKSRLFAEQWQVYCE